LLADGNLTAVDRALAAAREHVDTARALFDRGVVVRSDLLRAEVLVGSLERQRIDADNATRTARSQLNYVMGTDGEIRLRETDAWPCSTRHLPWNSRWTSRCTNVRICKPWNTRGSAMRRRYGKPAPTTCRRSA